MVTVSLIQIMNIAEELGYYNDTVSGSVFDFFKEHYNLIVVPDNTLSNIYYTIIFTNNRHKLFFTLKYAHILKAPL